GSREPSSLLFKTDRLPSHRIATRRFSAVRRDVQTSGKVSRPYFKGIGRSPTPQSGRRTAMQAHSTSAYAARHEPRADDRPAQLRGRTLAATRAALAGVAALALAIFVVSVPTRYSQLRTLAATGLGAGWTSGEARAALNQIGLPVAIYAAS